MSANLSRDVSGPQFEEYATCGNCATRCSFMTFCESCAETVCKACMSNQDVYCLLCQEVFPEYPVDSDSVVSWLLTLANSERQTEADAVTAYVPRMVVDAIHAPSGFQQFGEELPVTPAQMGSQGNPELPAPVCPATPPPPPLPLQVMQRMVLELDDALDVECRRPWEMQVMEDNEKVMEHNGEEITTMMICNIPCRLGHDDIVVAIDAVGFESMYDFVYIPRRKCKHDSNMGYAFVNFTSAEYAANFTRAFQSFQFPGTRSSKRCTVKQAHQQGVNALREMTKLLHQQAVNAPRGRSENASNNKKRVGRA